MKIRISIFVSCLVSCCVQGMQPKQVKKVDNPILQEKKKIFEGLMSSDCCIRTQALVDLQKRCASHISWPQVKQRIHEHLKHINTLVAFSQHPALGILKRRVARFDILSYDELDIKQDLICIDERAMQRTKAYQVTHTIQVETAAEIKKTKQSLVNLMKKLEFKPLEYADDDRCVVKK